jgi:hypothetical protein
MLTRVLYIDPEMRSASRLPSLAGTASGLRTAELATLIMAGAAAALSSTYLSFGLGIPGHRILFSVFPIALGLALVPRRAAGTVMGCAAMATIGALAVVGVRVPGAGGLTSLILIGPLLDLVLRRAGSGWRLYAAFIAAGASANVLAFAVRAAVKLAGVPPMGGGAGGARPVSMWLSMSVWTYLLAGMLAGLISAAAWFQLRSRSEPA